MLLWTWACRNIFHIGFCFLWIYSRGRIAISYDSSIFNHFRMLHTVFYDGFTSLHFQQEYTKVSFSPHLLFFAFFMLTILTGMRQSHYGFDLHFPSDLWCWASFHISVVLINLMSISSIIESGLLKSQMIMFNSSLHFSQFCFLYFGLLLLGAYMLIIVTSQVSQTIKASAYNAGDLGSIPGLGRSPGKGNDNLLQYSCLENPMDWGAWQATVHGVAKSRTQLSSFTTLHYAYNYCISSQRTDSFITIKCPSLSLVIFLC